MRGSERLLSILMFVLVLGIVVIVVTVSRNDGAGGSGGRIGDVEITDTTDGSGPRRPETDLTTPFASTETDVPAAPTEVDLPNFGTDMFGRPGAVLDLLVRDRATNAVAGADVELFRDLSFGPLEVKAGERVAAGRTDDDGFVRLEGIPSLDRYILCILHDDYAPVRYSAIAFEAGDVRHLDATLEAGFRVAGIVVDEANKPLADAEVRVFRPGRSMNPSDIDLERSARTDAEGRFITKAVGRGARNLVASREGYATVARSAVRIDRRIERTSLRFRLGREYRLAGRVEDSRGRPIAGARVNARGATSGRITRELSSSARTRTDASGFFEMKRLAAGSYLVRADKAGYTHYSPKPVAVVTEGEMRKVPEAEKDHRASLRRVEAGAREVTLTLAQGLVLEGQVVAAHTGKPVTAFVVGVRASPGATSIVTSTTGERIREDDGRFAYTVPAAVGTPPRLVLTVGAPGFADTTVEVKLYELGQGTPKLPERIGGITVRLERGAMIEGVIRNRLGRPVEEALVFVEREIENAAPGGRPFASRSGTDGLTDADGRYQVSGLIEGKYRLRVTHPLYADAGLGEAIVVGSSGTYYASDVLLSRGGRVHGVVRDDKGRPLDDVRVMLRSDDGHTIRHERTGVTGRYDFGNLIPGDYRLVLVTHRGCSFGRRPDEVRPRVRGADRRRGVGGRGSRDLRRGFSLAFDRR